MGAAASFAFLTLALAHAGSAVTAAAPAPPRVTVVVEVDAQRARVFHDDRAVLDVRVAFGQAEGPKVQQGDNKTPRGRYRVLNKSKGPFGGRWAAYYGGHWIKVSYPNSDDADRGLRDGLISKAEAAAIKRADARGVLPPQNTALGGGIGFHGWIEEWQDPAAGEPPLGLSWGCIVLHLHDVAAFYAAVPEGAVVEIR